MPRLLYSLLGYTLPSYDGADLYPPDYCFHSGWLLLPPRFKARQLMFDSEETGETSGTLTPACGCLMSWSGSGLLHFWSSSGSLQKPLQSLGYLPQSVGEAVSQPNSSPTGGLQKTQIVNYSQDVLGEVIRSLGSLRSPPAIPRCLGLKQASGLAHASHLLL